MAQGHTAAPGGRGAWQSKLGFILAASGSAIGLGNIVFFASNAYQYGGGAFYLPYFIALFVLGIPVMVLEFSLGSMTGRSLPLALRRVVGPRGEFVGWWSLASALFITMYYVTMLGWALSMMVGTVGSLFEGGASAPFEGLTEPTEGANVQVYFFGMIATWWPVLAVAFMWGLNLLVLWKGTATIERAVRFLIPMMWLFMIVLIVRGLTLPGGFDGVLYLFTPDFEGIASFGVWQGAFAQMFFSLSLGLGTMTAYASYLPRDADQVNNSLLVSFLNCGFEYIAGVAIFALLFAFSLNPAGSTLSLSFFVVPQGIAEFPFWVKGFGFMFFFLVVIAGLTSSVSLIEGMASALIDKLQVPRARALAMVAVPGILGSIACALPFVVDPGLSGNGTAGLNLLDILDHWAFRYSLLTVGLLECLLVGWVFGADRLRAIVNAHTKFRLGPWFDVLIKFVAPALLAVVMAGNLWEDLSGVLYGSDWDLGAVSWFSIPLSLLGENLDLVFKLDASWFPVVVPLVWLVGTLLLAGYLTYGRRSVETPAAL